MSGLTTVSCQISYDVTLPTSLVLQVAAARRGTAPVAGESLEISGATGPLDVTEMPAPDGGRQHLVDAPPGPLTVAYSASLDPAADAPPPAAGRAERIVALRPSRYCPSDRLVGFASGHFGHLPNPVDRVRAICDHVATYVGYELGSSDPHTDAADTLLAGQGVCRDFAHVVVALCRAVDVPARVAAVYAPGLSPMDFHLVVETALAGCWHVWDATRMAPRASLVRIATGRDAADTAFATVLSGQAELTDVTVMAVAAEDLTTDDHRHPRALP